MQEDQSASRQALLGPEVFGYDGPFNKNILNFVRRHGVEVTIPAGIKCWFITLRDGTRMHVYAETVGDANATCDQCRIMGTYITYLRATHLPWLRQRYL
jgi:hypothetical protein